MFRFTVYSVYSISLLSARFLFFCFGSSYRKLTFYHFHSCFCLRFLCANPARIDLCVNFQLGSGSFGNVPPTLRSSLILLAVAFGFCCFQCLIIFHLHECLSEFHPEFILIISFTDFFQSCPVS